ncbi:MAG: hypothetical protein GXY29_03985 [Thermotogaceae bacterium]|jgi:hypothetical protein|nr:hypothetical protein [Thermotogaceae bacterium]
MKRTSSVKSSGCLVNLLVFCVIGLSVWAAIATWFAARNITFEKILKENQQLKEALTRITAEEQIGYAKVIKQEVVDGKIMTTMKFVETAREDPSAIILQKEYTIEGEIVFFDAMIVRFNDQLLLDGKERALYLWRRVYGENTPPSQGFPIEEREKEPERYKEIFAKLNQKDKEIFWSSVWELSNDPEKLKQLGISAIYGNATYTKLKPGMVYIFKINHAGQVYPEIIPDF